MGMEKPILQVAKGLQPDRIPVWFMRQAGRYLPEYREIRKDISFVDLCKNPKLAAEVTVQPLRRFDLDAAIIFADILLIPTAMGQSLRFAKNHGPILEPTVRDIKAIDDIDPTDTTKHLTYVGDALAETKPHLKPHQTLIGFAGAPFTVASYMVEGGPSKNFEHSKKLLYTHPEAFALLMDKLATSTIAYLEMQLEHGAEILMIFDSWAHQLTPDSYAQFVMPATERIFKHFKAKDVPTIFYSGQSGVQMASAAKSSADVIQIDWRLDLSKAVARLKQDRKVVKTQGNLDPLVLTTNEKAVKAATLKTLQNAESSDFHIFNVGHGLIPSANPDALTWVIDTIRDYEKNK